MGWRVTFGGTKRVVTPEEREADPWVSVWEGGTVVLLDDISPDVFDAIAADDPGNGNWWNVYTYPGATGGRLYKVVEAAAQQGGVEAPAKPSTMREADALIELLEKTQPVDEEPMQDGFPQEPGETEVGSSSTSPGPLTAGSPQTSDDSPLETS